MPACLLWLAALLWLCSMCAPQAVQGAGTTDQRPWTYRVAGHLLSISRQAAHRRILRSLSTNSTCVPSSLQPEFDCQLDCSRETVKNDLRVPPPTKHIIHWSLDDSPGQKQGIRFGVFYRGFKINEDLPYEPWNIWKPGWVGMGWSAWDPRGSTMPPQMLNGTAVMGWIDSDGSQQVAVYDLWSKVSTGVKPSLDGFTITNTSVAYTPENAMIMRFRRAFEAEFVPGLEQVLSAWVCGYFLVGRLLICAGMQRMLIAHHHRKAGLIRHNHRAGIVGDFALPGSIRVVGTRLDPAWVQTHAWCMTVVFAFIFPTGIIWARYSRDTFHKWFMVHIGIQVTGLLLMLAAAIIALARNRPFDHHLNHFQLGVAVIALVLLQPCSAIPRLMMHHKTEMKSAMFAYIHWTTGRAALVFGFVNMFFGIARYRTQFTMGYWAEPLLGFWIAVLVLLCLIGETRLWMKSTIQLREENDDLSRRMASIEQRLGEVKLKSKFATADSMLFNQAGPQLPEPEDASLLASDAMKTDNISQYMEPLSRRSSGHEGEDDYWNHTSSTQASRLSGFTDAGLSFRGKP